MGTKYRKAISKYGMYITLLQIAQMVGGMFVITRALAHQAAGEECHVDSTNSVLGLGMYASYFVLFFKLFVDNYYLKPKGVQKRKSIREVARSVSRKATHNVLAENVPPADGEEATKKMN